MTLVKVGIVFAFATGWPAYQAMVYDVAIMAPSELGETIAAAAALPGSTNDLGLHLDAVDQQFRLLAIENASRPLADQTSIGALPQLFSGFDTFALESARIIYLIGSVGSYTFGRVVAGVLLALGPLFIAFLLFDATRGLTEGWLRALLGAVLGTLVTSLVLGVQLAFFEPWLTELIAQRVAAVSVAGAASQLFATATLFALILGGAIAIAARLAWSLRFPSFLAVADGFSSIRPGQSAVGETAGRAPGRTVRNGDRSRALVVADAISMLDRRESAMISARGGTVGDDRAGLQIALNGRAARNFSGAADQAVPVAGMTRRRSGARVSATAQRRDGTP